ncbi:MAG: hypothetical protein KDK24_01845 [Pseudooceanicola sp.]|nr:hypothetical protein [Pseudooceanicola sp.]
MTTTRRNNRLIFPAVVLVAGIGVAAGARAEGIRGLFCNTQADVGLALSLMEEGRTPGMAAALVNVDAMRCSHADTIRYVVDQTVIVDGAGSGTIYRGQLTGVVAGGRVMPVTPPAQLYFVTPDARLIVGAREV